MTELQGWIQVITVGGFCLGLYKIANGRLNKKVNRDTCHAHVDGLKAMIVNLESKVDDNKKDLTTYISDVKNDTLELLRRNGGERKT